MIFKVTFQIGSRILQADLLLLKNAMWTSTFGRSILSMSSLFAICFLMLMVNTVEVSAQNPIVRENLLPGNPKTEWDINGAGDLNIQGFATDMSVNKGTTVRFKINVTGAVTYRIRIYRLGYYSGSGARLIIDLGNFTGRVQPSPVSNSSTGLVDCGNWIESASWAVPDTAVSGLYLAKLTRSDNNGSSHIAFVVRDDNANSNLLFKTSDATWQAYNVYGGNSLYVGSTSYPGGHAVKVSYNRPFITRNGGGGGGAMEDWLFNAEYPMIRWLERNGYDVSYTTDVDMSRDATPITPSKHKVLLSVGHDEYWSQSARTRFENARGQGVHLAFLSGNEVYWKTRWENSIDGTNTPYRTLVCYKEGTLGENVCGGKCDPVANTWTGLWRDGCNFPNADGCRPENALSGQISWVDATGSITVPSTFQTAPFWRHTSIASGQSATFPNGTLGYEWDGRESAYSSSYPSGRQVLSSTNLAGKIHELSLYTHASGAKVFGAGTVQWSWGLDNVHDRGSAAPSRDMQQATANLFWDMGVVAGSLQSDLVSDSAPTDTQAPTTSINSPANGATVTAGSAVSISGTATDLGGGTVTGVDVSTDGGSTWQRANGTTNWTYSWTPVFNGSLIIKSRGIDNSGNTEPAGTAPATNAITVNVTGSSQIGPFTIWSANTIPAVPDDPDAEAIELGVKFRSSVNGFITGIRFYKSSTNTGTHIANLWSLTGANLARATFTSETASGWQQMLFSTPIAIVAGTTYVASYHTPTGHYSVNENYFTSTTGITPYVQALGNGVDGPNGVYNYSSNTIFPNSSFSSSNYWVDVVFTTNTAPDTSPPTVTATNPASSATGVNITSVITATFNEDINAATLTSSTFELRNASNTVVTGTVSYNSATRTATLTPAAALSNSTVYTATLKGGTTDPRIKDLADNALGSDFTWNFTTVAATPLTVTANTPANGATGILTSTAVTATFNQAIDPATLTATTFELRNGANTLISGSLTYNSTTRVATFTPTATLANSTVYTATLRGGTTDPRIKTATGISMAADYVWNFTTVAATPLTVTANTPANGATGVLTSTVITATFNQAIDPATLTATTFELRNAANTLIPGALNYNSTTRVATFTPTATLANSTVYTATLKGGATDPRIKTPTGISMAADYVWNFTTVAGGSQTGPFTIWSATTSPATIADPDKKAIEVGVKFRTSVNGFITGIRYYKSTTNTGTHVGTLWSRTGTVLGQATFTSETSSGWQQVLFNTPIAINAGTTYVASYHTNTGRYSINSNYFTTNVGLSPTLQALANGVDGPNGVYRYGANSIFPTSTTRSSNYWVDVVFAPNTAPDTSPPTVTATNPASSATGVSITSAITATFNEDINAATLSGSTFELRNAANTVVTGTVSYNSATRTATLTPAAALSNSTVYTATLKGGTTDPRIKDLAENALGADFTWNFTTVAATPLTVTANTPANGATGILTSTAVTATFNQAIDPATLTATTFELRNGANTLISGSLTYNSTTRVATFTPTATLANSTVYTATLRGGATDPRIKTATGISMAADYAWNFTTAAATPLTVTANTPANNATGILTSTSVTATFSQAIDPATLTATTFELRNAANTLIPGSLNYNSTTRVATFTPTATLANSTVYTATLRGGATDPRIKTATGISMAADYAWNFTTVAATPLTVTANTPANSATGILTSTSVTVTFSQAIDPATLTATTFELRNAANTLISGALNYNSTTRVATFTPTSILANSTVYTATLKGGATDPRIKTTSGVSMAADYAWSFTTAAATPLTVTANTPANNATGILTSTSVTATFSQAIDPATLTATTFELRNAGNTLIPGALSYNPTTRVATFTPTATLANSTIYTATLKGGATDPRIKTNAGVSMAADYVWNFTTVAATPLTVTANTPASGATGVLTSTAITATFNQAIDPITLTATTFELRNAANTLISGSLNYNSTTRVATFTPTSILANSTVYTATLRGGNIDPRIKDLAGTSLVSNYVWSFTTAAGSQTGPFSIWNSLTLPAIITEPDPSAVELGVKFRASVNGFITGIRFYKGQSNTGIHTANLWSRAGTNLARATFITETASGWQQVLFSSPVAITAGITYVASYHTPTGNYSVNENYFATGGIVSGNLQALAEGVDGSNGVYNYSSSSSFPSSSYNSSNYWVDVLFTTNSTPNPLQSTLATSSLLTAGPKNLDLMNVFDATLIKNNKISLICYPNPFSGNARVEFIVPTQESKVMLDIYNSMGTKTSHIYEGAAKANQVYSFQIDTLNLAAGIYFIYFKTSRGVESRKIVMN